MNLEDLLRTTVTAKGVSGKDVEVSPDFRVSVQNRKTNSGGVYIIIHPDGHDGETLDFVVYGNELEQI